MMEKNMDTIYAPHGLTKEIVEKRENGKYTLGKQIMGELASEKPIIAKQKVEKQVADKQMEKYKKIITVGLMALCVGFVIILLKAYLDGKFDSVETFRQYVAGFGLAAPLFLAAVQAAQVILPVLPGLLGCVVGALMFGSMGGFWCNYIGISAGSIIAFLLARKYGRGLVSKMFPGEKYENWAKWAAESKFYTVILFLGMVLPLFPDDYFCYFTGITKMSTRKFVTIIVLGKPWCILAYCIMAVAAVA